MQAGRLPIWRNAIENPQPLARMLCMAAAAILIGFELWPAISAQLDAAAPQRARASTTQSDANVEQIAAADLFGHAANQNANLPQTDLQITLRAVFAANDPKMASAVIETGDGAAQVVKIGGAVGSTATLQAVYPNRVVLSRNGALETLYFPTLQESVALGMVQNTAVPETSSAAEDIKKAAILQRLEELRARTPR